MLSAGCHLGKQQNKLIGNALRFRKAIRKLKSIAREAVEYSIPAVFAARCIDVYDSG